MSILLCLLFVYCNRHYLVLTSILLIPSEFLLEIPKSYLNQVMIAISMFQKYSNTPLHIWNIYDFLLTLWKNYLKSGFLISTKHYTNYLSLLKVWSIVFQSINVKFLIIESKVILAKSFQKQQVTLWHPTNCTYSIIRAARDNRFPI